MRVRATLSLSLAALTLVACSSVTPPPAPSSSAEATSTGRATTTSARTTPPPSTPTTESSRSGSSGTTAPESTGEPTPTAPPLDPATEAWFTADCTARVELRRLSQVSLGSTPEQQRASVEQIYSQHAAFDLATRDTLAALDPPAVPGGAEIKSSRVAEFTALHEQYTAGLATLTAADPKTTDELSAVIEQVEAAVSDAVAAVPQPTVAVPTDIAAQVAELPMCRPGALPSVDPSASSATAPSTGPSTTVFLPTT